MADLALRFGKDMLVVSSPIQEALRRAGIESVCDQALALLVEPETIEEAYRMETVAGPQCMVTPVADFTPARLVAVGAEGKGEALTEAALAVMAEFKPQHTLVEIAPAVCRWIPTPRRRLWKIATSTLVRRNSSMAAPLMRSF